MLYRQEIHKDSARQREQGGTQLTQFPSELAKCPSGQAVTQEPTDTPLVNLKRMYNWLLHDVQLVVMAVHSAQL